MADWNANIIEEFRSNSGKVGGIFEGDPMLILHATGAKSGAARMNPLLYRREGDRLFIFASKGGADQDPDWYYNVKANPSVTVELGSETMSASATEVIGSERDEIYGRQAASDARFDGYQKATERTIPVIELIAD